MILQLFGGHYVADNGNSSKKETIENKAKSRGYNQTDDPLHTKGYTRTIWTCK